MRNLVLFSILFILLVLDLVLFADSKSTHTPTAPQPTITKTPEPSPPPPESFVIPLRTHTFQTFNNCGPASLSMALSYHDIYISQQILGESLRPYQNPAGDNDDKSVTLDELAKKAEDYGLIAYHRPNGNTDLLKAFISHGYPVIVRTLTDPNEDIGHYRVVRGYTETTLIQDDSLQGKNLSYTLEDFNAIWEQFGYEYLVFVPPSAVPTTESILGENKDPNIAWTKSAQYFRKKLNENSEDVSSRFNLSVALYNTGDFKGSVREFEIVESSLPFRALWYQIEPIKAYFELENYDRVFQLTEKVLSGGNRAFSELYLVKSDAYRELGNTSKANEEHQKALLYNKHL